MSRSDPQFLAQWQERQELAEMPVATSRHAFFALPVAPQDYLEHSFQLALPVQEANQPPAFIEGWLGIRFRNLDARTPFVDILTRQDPKILLTDPQLYSQVLALIQTHYAMFEPHGFTVTLPVAQPPEADSLPPHQVWSQVWWQKLAACPQVAHRPLHVHPLKTLEELDIERFQSQYQFWRLLHHDLAPWVEPASAKELQQSMAAGLCYRACTPEGEEVGLIAGLPSLYREQRGILMLEAFIYPTYQGQGYGKALQAQFIQTLQHSDYKALWGTIYAENTASWRTAQACGRQLIEQECFFPL